MGEKFWPLPPTTKNKKTQKQQNNNCKFHKRHRQHSQCTPLWLQGMVPQTFRRSCLVTRIDNPNKSDRSWETGIENPANLHHGNNKCNTFLTRSLNRHSRPKLVYPVLRKNSGPSQRTQKSYKTKRNNKTSANCTRESNKVSLLAE